MLKFYIDELKRAIRVNARPPKLVLVGSQRRGVPLSQSKDIDFLLVLPNLGENSIICSNFGEVSACKLTQRQIKCSIRDKKIDIFIVKPEELPFALFHYTGPRSYNIRIRKYARDKGYKLNQYGIFHADTGRRVRHTFTTERDITRFLGSTYYAPNKRN